jgi:hypothetical protein
MSHYPGYTTGLENLDDLALRKALDDARAECSRGCADMEGMTARVFAIEAELEYRRIEARE